MGTPGESLEVLGTPSVSLKLLETLEDFLGTERNSWELLGIVQGCSIGRKIYVKLQRLPDSWWTKLATILFSHVLSNQNLSLYPSELIQNALKYEISFFYDIRKNFPRFLPHWWLVLSDTYLVAFVVLRRFYDLRFSPASEY